MFGSNIVAGYILMLTSAALLTALLVKGYKTKTLADYKILYAILINMCFVWMFTVIGATQSNSKPDQYTFGEFASKISILLFPISTLLFTWLYFETTTIIIGLKGNETKLRRMDIAVKILLTMIYSYFLICCLLFKISDGGQFTRSFLIIATILLSLVITLSILLMMFSIWKIRQFSKEIKNETRIVDSTGQYLL